MAKRGVKPKTARTSRRAAAPAPRDPRWDPPEYLDEEATRAWAHVVGLLAEAGNLARTDPTLVEAYAVNVSLMRAAHRSVADEGLASFTAQGGRIANPAVSALNSAAMRVKAIVSDLGLCPATSKYAAETSAQAKPESKWGDLLGVVG